jgi:hypothetical protein
VFRAAIRCRDPNDAIVVVAARLSRLIDAEERHCRMAMMMMASVIGRPGSRVTVRRFTFRRTVIRGCRRSRERKAQQ